VALNQHIAFYEALIPLKEKLEQKQAEVKGLENQIRRLVEQREIGSRTSSHSSVVGAAIEQKLDVVLRRLDQMDKRLAELEKANRK
jgi:plasmid stabilization system protein ParE